MITTRALTKHYDGTTALADVDLEVPPGSVYGLVGPNGAGKTTLLGILSGLRSPTSGSVEIDVPHSRIGVLPDTPQFDAWLTGREVVALARELTDPAGPPDRVAGVLGEAGLTEAADRAVGGYSRGMLQRLGIAATLVGDPDLVLLDEPCSALDPAGRRDVLDLIGRLRGRATVLFSSHILSDVQEVCDTVGILRSGRLLFEGPLADLLVGRAVPRYVVRIRPPSSPVVEHLRRERWVTAVDEVAADELVLAVTDLGDAERELPAALASAGARVVSIRPDSPTLEHVFLELTK